MTSSHINDSLSNSQQGAMLSVLGAFSQSVKAAFTNPAQQLSAVVQRLGVGAAVASITAIAALASPDAAAQTPWANAAPWATPGNVNDALQKNRQIDFANAATGVIADQRGLSPQQRSLAQLGALGAGAFANPKVAPAAAGIVGAAAALLIPNNGGNNNGNNGIWANAAPWGQSNQPQYQQPQYQQPQYQQSQRPNYLNGSQQANMQSQAAHQAYQQYMQLSEPQFQTAVQANFNGQFQDRDAAIVKFGQHWNAAVQMGLPLHNDPQQVEKFQMLNRMNSLALQHGAQTRATSAQSEPTRFYNNTSTYVPR